MNPEKCAEILRSFIKHREKMHKSELLLLDDYGSETGSGHINPETDCLYQAVKYALSCVETHIQ